MATTASKPGMKGCRLPALLFSLLHLVFFSGAVLAQDTGADPTPVPRDVVQAADPVLVLRGLDKVTARIEEIEVPLNEPVAFGSLTITARYCRSRPPEEQPETFAFLEIDNQPANGEPERVFTGWMVASSPALNALEHPVYDVWVLSCRMRDGSEFTGTE